MHDPALAQQANGQGMDALRRGDYRTAAAAFRHATEADATAAPLWLNLAHACRLDGDVAGERGALEQALQLDRTNFGAQLRMAQLLQRIGEEAQALVAWNGVLQLAVQAENLAPHITDELADGRAYSLELQRKLQQSIDTALAPHEPAWSETDQRRIRAFVDVSTGRRRIYQNQCAGVHYPFLPADEYFDRIHFPWLDQVEAASAAIKAELAGLLSDPGEALRPYVRMGEGAPKGPWDKLDNSMDWSACFLWEYGMENRVVTERCPATAALLCSLPLLDIPGRAPNAFFSILQPRSHIPPHTGVTNTRAIIHLALDIPPGCTFRVGGETREWVEGTAFAFDDTIDHEATNPTDRPRAVLIFDTWNPHLSGSERKALIEYFAASDVALAGPSPLG